MNNKKVPLAVVIGRFQPLHKGHLSIIEKAIEIADKVLILVGSSNQLPDFRNPFSYEERLELLIETLLPNEALHVRPLPDKPSDDEWAQDVIGHVISLEEDPSKVILVTNPKDEVFYAKTLLYPVETLDTIKITATELRHSWYTDSLWLANEFLPDASKELLKDHHDFNRLSVEYISTTEDKGNKTAGHPFGNPIEPVTFAVIVQDNKVLVGERAGKRGYGQQGLPGGFLEKGETTLAGCMREVQEEMGVSLENLVTSGAAKCMAMAVEENLDDLGARTLGVNYLFIVKPEETLDICYDEEEIIDYTWVPLKDILEDKTLLFYNHNLVTKRLISKL